jgi:alpha-1,2-mannosyltransferase
VWPNLLRFARDSMLVILAASVIGLSLGSTFGGHHYGDLRVFRAAGRAVLDGHSPYPPPDDSVLRGQDNFVYPAPAAVVMVPLALLPLPVAAAVFLVLSSLAILAAFRLSRLRDWRLAALMLSSVTVLQGLALGTVTPLLVLACAIAWRFRDRRWIPAIAVAGAVVLKLYLAPLILWLALTGRRGTALRAAGIALAVAFAGWATVGFAGLGRYPTLLRAVARVEGDEGLSVATLGQALGLGSGAARAIAAGLAVVLIGAAWRVRSRAHLGEEGAFALIVIACLVASPIVWTDYHMLLILPVILLAPRPSPLWAVPVIAWFYGGNNGVLPTWKIVFANLVLAVVAAVALGAVTLRRPAR